jgi:KUP system potassium uptake protein
VVVSALTRSSWGWSRLRAVPILVLFLSFDLPFFAANAFKLLDGGWVPVLIGMGFITAMLIWSKGRTLLYEEYARRFPSLDDALPALRRKLIARTPGTGVFLASSTRFVPPVLMHLVERSRTLHEEVILVTITTDDRPVVPTAERYELQPLGEGFQRLVARYGFMERPDVPLVLAEAIARRGTTFQPADATYYLGRESLMATKQGILGRLFEQLFSYLQRNSVSADRDFRMPPRQVMEIGIQVDL